MGRFGTNNLNTEYFKVKLETAIKSNKSKTNNINSKNNHMLENNSSHSFLQSEDNNISNQMIVFNKNNNNNNKSNEITGKAVNFIFRIFISKIYEPLTFSIYDLENNFVTNIYFDKNLISRYFKIININSNIYSEVILKK